MSLEVHSTNVLGKTCKNQEELKLDHLSTFPLDKSFKKP